VWARRFFIHKSIEKFAAAVVESYGLLGERALLFPSHAVATRCVGFFHNQAPELSPQQVRIVDLVPSAEKARSDGVEGVSPKVSAVIFPGDHFKIAKAFWQHSGDGVSSRRAEYCHNLFSKGILIDSQKREETPRMCKGPKRYQKKTSIDITGHPSVTSNSSPEGPSGAAEVQEPTQFVEERFGRNLDLSLTSNAKLAIRRRIAGSLTADVGLTEALALEEDHERSRKVAGFSKDDVYLYPTGMSSIFNTHRNLMAARGHLKSINYGLEGFSS
jgi:cystathionine gamma-synthase